MNVYEVETAVFDMTASIFPSLATAAYDCLQTATNDLIVEPNILSTNRK